MSHELLLNELWQTTVSRLGGVAAIDASAREKRAFPASTGGQVRATDLLRLILAYCLGGMGLRSTSAWAASAGLADLSNVALLQRLRNCGAWMEHLVGLSLVGGAVPAADGRRIRLLDGTTVPKAGKEARKNNGLWRLHCTFDLPSERFSHIELTDEKGGERLSRTPCRKRRYPHCRSRISFIPILWRMSWSRAPMSSCARAGKAPGGSPGMASRSISWLLSKALKAQAFSTAPSGSGAKKLSRWPSVSSLSASPLRRPKRREPKHGAPHSGKATSYWAARSPPRNGLSLSPRSMQTPSLINAIGELYRARWRIEMAFKRLKSLIGLSGPPGEDPEVAKTWILAHLLMILLLGPHASAPGISPRMAA